MVRTTDEEQLETIKEWWREYGKLTVIAVIIAIAGSFGWRYWQRHQRETRLQASVVYTEMLNSIALHKTAVAAQFAAHLEKEYSGTPYASLAALLQAKQAVEQQKFTAAEKKLTWVVHHADTDALVQIARIRAARVLLTDHKPKQALTMLATVNDNAYLPAIDEMKGDIYLQMSNKSKARQAYTNAVAALPPNKLAHEALLKMKLAQLA